MVGNSVELMQQYLPECFVELCAFEAEKQTPASQFSYRLRLLPSQIVIES